MYLKKSGQTGLLQIIKQMKLSIKTVCINYEKLSCNG